MFRNNCYMLIKMGLLICENINTLIVTGGLNGFVSFVTLEQI